MNIKLYAALILFAAFSLGCVSQRGPEQIPSSFTNVVPAYATSNAIDNSLVYALPKTMLRLTVNAEKVYHRRGPLFRYSELYLNIDDVITEDATEWLLKSIEVEPIGIRDQDHIYKVDFSGNTGSGNIELAENGCIKSVNCSHNEPVEVETVLQEVLTLMPDTSFASIALSEELLRANSTSKMAEEAAAFIYRIRENRVALVSGELDHFPADGESFDLSLKNLDKLEADYVSLFAGKSSAEQVSFTFNYVPKTAVTKEILFRFSKFKGVVALDDFSGSPAFITLLPGELINLADNDPEPRYDDKGELIEANRNNGFFYRMPALSTLQIDYDNKPLYQNQFHIAQFGKVLSLPADLLDGKNVGIRFYPHTGAIKKIINK